MLYQQENNLETPSTYQPQITVITLSYNSDKYIFEAIESVLKQTYPKIEYIISDDGSKEFPEKHICDFLNAEKKGNISYKIIQNKENLGTVKNLNGAIKESHGEIIFLLAADDAFDNENVISNWVRAFREKDAEVMTSCAKMCGESLDDTKFVIPSNGNIKQLENFTPDRLYLSHILAVFGGYSSPIPSGGAMAYTRACIDKYDLFDETYKLMEDYPAIEVLLRNNVQIKLWKQISLKHRDGGISSNSKFNKIIISDYKRYQKEIIKTVFRERLWDWRTRRHLICNHMFHRVFYILKSCWHTRIFGTFSLSEITILRHINKKLHERGRGMVRKWMRFK